MKTGETAIASAWSLFITLNSVLYLTKEGELENDRSQKYAAFTFKSILYSIFSTNLKHSDGSIYLLIIMT